MVGQSLNDLKISDLLHLCNGNLLLIPTYLSLQPLWKFFMFLRRKLCLFLLPWWHRIHPLLWKRRNFLQLKSGVALDNFNNSFFSRIWNGYRLALSKGLSQKTTSKFAALSRLELWLRLKSYTSTKLHATDSQPTDPSFGSKTAHDG